MRRSFLFAVSALCFYPAVVSAQAPPADSGGSTQPQQAANQNAAAVVLNDSIQALTPAIDRLHQTLVALNVSKWKVPGGVRGTAQSDIDSMQRDVSNVLPGLIEKAKDAPHALSPAFAVFRNIDALYDVLLRVTETATLAGAQADAGRLEEARAGLEEGRSTLGNAILQASTDQDAEVLQLRAAAARAAAPPPVSNKTVVDDGPPAPASKSKAGRKHKSAAPGAGQPAPPQ